MTNLTTIADTLAEGINKIDNGELFDIISDGGGKGLPLVAFKLKKELKYDEFAIAAHLRMRGWIVPAYTMAPHTEKMKLLRVVVREDFSASRSETLLRDIQETVSFLEDAPETYAAHLTRQKEKNTAAHKNSAVHVHHAR